MELASMAIFVVSLFCAGLAIGLAIGVYRGISEFNKKKEGYIRNLDPRD